jgi:hypothetical protein
LIFSIIVCKVSSRNLEKTRSRGRGSGGEDQRREGGGEGGGEKRREKSEQGKTVSEGEDSVTGSASRAHLSF